MNSDNNLINGLIKKINYITYFLSTTKQIKYLSN
jgi:hypothetical protein